MGRPGILVYFDLLGPMAALTYEEKGRLFEAMLVYGNRGIAPDFEGMLGMAWAFIKPKIDKDSEEYNKVLLKRQYANVCKERKKKGEPEISFNEWLSSVRKQDHMDSHGTTWSPTTTTSTTTTTTTSTTTNTSTNNSRAKSVYGEFENVYLTQKEFTTLKAEVHGYKEWIDKLSRYIASTGKHYENHYITIRNWIAREKQEAVNKQKTDPWSDINTNDYSEFDL